MSKLEKPPKLKGNAKRLQYAANLLLESVNAGNDAEVKYNKAKKALAHCGVSISRTPVNYDKPPKQKDNQEQSGDYW
jgi:hypothetical protein